MNTLRCLLITLLLLAAPLPISADSTTLPDYHHEAGKVHLRKCDSDTTHIIMYRTATYYVTEATTKSGDSFIMFYSTRGEAHFLTRQAGASDHTELSREKWYEKIKQAGPNYFNHVRGIPPSDCYLAEIYYQCTGSG